MFLFEKVIIFTKNREVPSQKVREKKTDCYFYKEHVQVCLLVFYVLDNQLIKRKSPVIFWAGRFEGSPVVCGRQTHSSPALWLMYVIYFFSLSTYGCAQMAGIGLRPLLDHHPLQFDITVHGQNRVVKFQVLPFASYSCTPPPPNDIELHFIH